jgi:hypothetical protein
MATAQLLVRKNRERIRRRGSRSSDAVPPTFCDGDNLADVAWRDWAWVGAIVVERKMSAGALIIVDVSGEDPAHMALVEDHDVIQTLAANRTDHALDVCVLPG